ncbi:hypothetical protein [Lentzea sp. CC55]|uniref:hypothetical protein n=1 Tax=Lentzea sp. CC55 TaxID=2884909 RepID=UPI001F3C669A|nr:hypothetical protein [Lentzea sp. CC55]MCG8926684.1 hypothetical protein [Lentzea sp. CC55]
MNQAAMLIAQEFGTAQWIGAGVAIPSVLFIIWALWREQFAALYRKVFWKRDPRRKP